MRDYYPSVDKLFICLNNVKEWWKCKFVIILIAEFLELIKIVLYKCG